ncbi:MAG TPA: N-acetylglucosamine-6-phosphate deacetylase [Mycobacteriales bacterium]|nr:N-acetylglucosamine-6-phosphate deacetylase [Mycobacteriales bacterium]
MIVAAGRVVTPQGVLAPGWVEVRGERIEAVGAGEPPWPADHPLPAAVLVPGFVDIHGHGGGGASYLTTDPDEAARAAAFHLAHGTTTAVASLVTTPLDVLRRQVDALADLVEAGVLAGLHLEGPWLAAARCGAHPVALLRPPAAGEVGGLLAAGRGTVRMVTLAPELAGGLAAVRAVVEAGAVAAVGHTDATYDVTRAAIEAGATVATHLYNGMRPVHHREPGPVVAALADPRVTVEIINDGAHLHPAVVRGVVDSAGVGRVALVTDAIAAAGLADGRYTVGGQAVVVTDGVVRLAGGGSMAGSTLTMDAAFRRAACEVGVSLPAAAEMCAGTPAAALGLADVGALSAGRRADLVALDGALRVVGVLARGRWAVCPPLW